MPFLKVVNDTAVAVNQGGKRKGAVCAYLETWHLDIEEFLELRKNTGDDRRRTHDMNTANWIPDLFMKRVMEDGEWTLFSPSDVPDLHDKFGKAFEEAYIAYEAQGRARRDQAVQEDAGRRPVAQDADDAVRDRPSLDHVQGCLQHALARSSTSASCTRSNLCTEITLNTSDTEIAVCNLGSVNLLQHLKDGAARPRQAARRPSRTAMRMLDNVIDINYYAVKKARDSNLRHRPVGLGIMGFQDCLYELRVPYASRGGRRVRRPLDGSGLLLRLLGLDRAGRTSAAATRATRARCGTTASCRIDSLELLAEERGGYVEVDRSATLDWDALRERIKQHGMRNSNCVAIAPTATISNIIGVDASIEPNFGNLSVKSNLSGEFTVVNEYLVRDLKRLGLWDEVMVIDLKYFDGSLRAIDRVPAGRARRSTPPRSKSSRSGWSKPRARRQKWIDQAQSLNIYMAGASGKKLDETYKLAWLRGLKTTYYLRTHRARRTPRSRPVKAGQLNAVSQRHARRLRRLRTPRRSGAGEPMQRRRPTSSSARSTIRTAKRVSKQCANRARDMLAMHDCDAIEQHKSTAMSNEYFAFRITALIIRRIGNIYVDLGRRSQALVANTADAAARRNAARCELPHLLSAQPQPRACSTTAPLSTQPLPRRPQHAASAPRQRRRQAHHQRPDRRQPAGAVQVQVGLGEVPRHLRQPLDAAGSQHDARHRALEGPERPDRRRAPHRQAQPRLLRHRRFAGRQQHRARHLPPHHGARVPPVPAAPGLRRSDPHPRLPVHRRIAGPGRERDLQRLQRSRSRSATRTSS